MVTVWLAELTLASIQVPSIGPEGLDFGFTSAPDAVSGSVVVGVIGSEGGCWTGVVGSVGAGSGIAVEVAPAHAVRMNISEIKVAPIPILFSIGYAPYSFCKIIRLVMT